MRELELTKDYLPDIPITTERYDLYSLTKNLIDLSIFSISEVGLINKAIINNDFLNESIKRKIKKKEEEIITRQEDNTTGSRIIIDAAIKNMCSKAGLYEMRKLSYKYTDTFLYDLIEIINDVNLLKLLYYEMEEKGIDYLKNTTVIMYLESNPSLISKEEYNDIIDNEKCKIIGGTKTKYIINNDKFISVGQKYSISSDFYMVNVLGAQPLPLKLTFFFVRQSTLVMRLGQLLPLKLTWTAPDPMLFCRYH